MFVTVSDNMFNRYCVIYILITRMAIQIKPQGDDQKDPKKLNKTHPKPNLKQKYYILTSVYYDFGNYIIKFH